MPRKKKQDLGFGPRLTAIRKARGLTQVQLARTAATTQRAISYYETDDGVPAGLGRDRARPRLAGLHR